jgi:hypothetical protein
MRRDESPTARMSVRDPRPSRAGARASAVAFAVVAVLAALTFAGCDNPSCIYGGDCFGGGGGGELGSNPATVPDDNAWLLPTQPQVSGFFPSGDDNAGTTPVVLRFNESMAPQSLIGAFDLIAVDSGFGGTGLPVPMFPPALIGDGRMLVLLPTTKLQGEKSYELRLRENAKVFDLTGTPLQVQDGGVFGSFGVAAEDPDGVKLVATWPPDNSDEQSRTGEIAVVFDRKVVAQSVNIDSFAVTVGGQTPAQNPPPTAAEFAATSGVSAPDTRAWRWRSTGDDGQAIPLGPAANVALTLSPAGHEIEASEGEPAPVLPESTIEFDLANFSAPLSAQIVSLPPDAIGIANLDGSRPLELAVEVKDGLPSDVLGVFVFGTSLGTDPHTVALFREVSLSAAGYDPTTDIATLGEEELDLASSTSPVEARFADGAVAFALRVERSGTSSPVRVLDLEPDQDGTQSPLLDTTRPILQELWPAGSGLAQTRSDLADLVVTGRANEPIRAAEVQSSLGTNGPLAPVCAWDEPDSAADTGLFAAAPVLLGVIPPNQLPLDFELLVFDRAFNPAAAPSAGTLRQIGAVGPGAALPGAPTVSVEVFDAALLGPVAGARVFTHSLSGPSLVLEDSAVTDPNGRATLLAAASGSTLVTVDAQGFDLFTIQDLPVARLGVPLQRSNSVFAVHQGRLSTPDQDLTDLVKWSHDSRLIDVPGKLVPVQSCASNPITQTFDCLFGPAPLAVGRVGAATVAVLDPPPNEFVYSAASFLKGWGTRFPAPELASGTPSALTFTLTSALDAASVPEEQQALDGPALDLIAAASVHLDLEQLVSDPVVTLEARLRSLPGALLAGHGVPFALGGTPIDTWRLRCAFPGLVDFTDGKYPGDELGELVSGGQIDPDLFLRVELVDLEGRASVRRPRFSVVGGGPVVTVDAPVVTSPAEGSVTSGPSYAVTFEDELDGSLAPAGLHHVLLSASDGRRWHVWLPIPNEGSAASATVWLPPIEGSGGEPLVSGPVSAVVESLTWPGFDPSQFLWSDLEREYDVRVRSAPVAFTQP